MLKYAIAIVLIAFVSSAGAASSYSSVLAKYNVSSAVSGILLHVQLHIGNSNYTLLYLHSSPYLLANDTNGTLVFSSSEASAIAGNYIMAQALNSSLLHSAYTQMQNYEASSASSINACAQVTGITGTVGVKFTCTLANYCQSCSAIPACKKVLVKTGGPDEAFGLGIGTFEGQYANLTSDYAEFYSAINNINATNAQTSVSELNGAFAGINSITRSIYQNPIFPPTANITPSMYSQCGLPQNLGSRTNSSLNNAPWFCNAVGYCPLTTYNYSALSSISSLLSEIASLPISATAVSLVAANISNNDYSYYKPILYKKKAEEYSAILNTTLSGYSKLVNNSIALSAHVSNATFINALSALQRSYSNLSSNFISLNLTSYNKTIAAQMAALSSAYAGTNSTYSSIKRLSDANTKVIIEYQLNSAEQTPQLSALAFSEYKINTEINSKINNTKAAYASLQSINQSLQSSSPQTPLLPEIARALDSGIVTYMLAGSSSPYSSKLAMAPSYAALVSLIIGIILFAILFITYSRLNKIHRIRAKPRARRNWRIIFGAAIVLIIIDVAATYYSASAASSFTPASAFLSALHASKTVFIINNGTSSGIVNCSKSISSELASQSKSVSIINISSTGLCSINGFVGNESSCIDRAASRGYPAIVLSNGNSSYVKAYSFYGSTLFASGSSDFMNQCVPAQLIG